MDSAWRADMEECLAGFNIEDTFVIEGGNKKIENTLKQLGDNGGLVLLLIHKSQRQYLY